jgi:hypothetical protein
VKGVLHAGPIRALSQYESELVTPLSEVGDVQVLIADVRAPKMSALPSPHLC